MGAVETIQPTHSGRLGYRPALDGLRAVAIGAVVLYHATGQPGGGGLGVDIFFVLSGFLITTLLVEEHDRAGRVSLGAFYRRRAYRLLPALIVMLGVVLVITKGAALAGAIAGIVYFSNIVLASNVDAMPSELRHLWSLAEEEQFYLVWPVALFLVLRARRRLAVALLAAAIVFTQVRVLELAMDGAGWNRIAFGIDTRSSSILIGCLLGLVLPRVRLPKRLEPLIVAALIAALAVPLTDVALFTGPPFIVSVLTALLICSVLTTDSTIARVLSTRVFVFLGVISYALYLWHIPIFEAFGVDDGHTGLKAVPAVALSIAAAVGVVLPCRIAFPAAQAACRIGDRADNELDPAAFAPEIAAPRRSCGRSPALGVVSHIRVAQTRALALFLPGQIMGETRGTRYAATAPRRKSTISLVVAPGPKTSATPSDLSSSASS